MVEETTQNYPIALECLQNLTPKVVRCYDSFLSLCSNVTLSIGILRC